MADEEFFPDSHNGFSDDEPDFCHSGSSWNQPMSSSNDPPLTSFQSSDTTKVDPSYSPVLPSLANLFPVYVGNFRCKSYDNLAQRIRLYFASKGLAVRLWFHNKDDYFEKFQMKAGLFDFLVYFGSLEDAQRAIKICNRDVFEYYPLNVFPGRQPVFFDLDRTVYYENMKCGRIYSELFFERRIGRWGQLSCAVKFDMVTGAAEFCVKQGQLNALKKESLWKPSEPGPFLRKQRFLEQDLAGFIAQYLDQNPHALSTYIDDNVTRSLAASIPINLPRFRGKRRGPQPLRRGPSKKAMEGMARRKRAKQQRYIEKCHQAGITPKIYSNKKNKKKNKKKN